MPVKKRQQFCSACNVVHSNYFFMEVTKNFASTHSKFREHDWICADEYKRITRKKTDTTSQNYSNSNNSSNNNSNNNNNDNNDNINDISNDISNSSSNSIGEHQGFFVGSISMLLELLCNLVCSCGQVFQFNNYTQSKYGQAIRVDLKCNNGHCKSWYSTPIIQGQYEVPRRFIFSWILAGGTYQSYKLFNTIFNMNSYSHTAFFECEKELDPVINSMVEQNLSESLEEAKKLQVPTTDSIDCRWSSRRNGNEATVSAYCIDTQSMIDLVHVIKCRRVHESEKEKIECQNQTHSTRLKATFHGPSKSMESYGVNIIFKRLKDSGLVVKYLVYDNDLSSKNIVKQYYPEMIELLDIGHCRKNVRKKVIDLGKEFSILKGLGDRISNYIGQCVKNAKQDKVKFQAYITNIVNHLSGKCTQYCIHDENKVSKRKPIPLLDECNVKAKEALEAVLASLVSKSEQYAHMHNSNANEAFNNVITKFIPKRLDFPFAYVQRAGMALLQMNTHGHCWTLEALKRFGFEVSLRHEMMVEKLSDWYERSRKRKASDKYKQQEYYNEQAKKVRNIGIATLDLSQYTYGENDYDYDDTVPSLLDLSSLKSKKQGCSSCGQGKRATKGCSSKKCPCVRNGIGCSAFCGCKNCSNINGEKLNAHSATSEQESQVPALAPEPPADMMALCDSIQQLPATTPTKKTIRKSKICQCGKNAKTKKLTYCENCFCASQGGCSSKCKCDPRTCIWKRQQQSQLVASEMDPVQEFLNFDHEEQSQAKNSENNEINNIISQPATYTSAINETYDEMLELDEENVIKKSKIQCYSCSNIFDGASMELQLRGVEGIELFVWHCQNCVVEDD